jgi:hypothetical protein
MAEDADQQDFQDELDMAVRPLQPSSKAARIRATQGHAAVRVQHRVGPETNWSNVNRRRSMATQLMTG